MGAAAIFFIETMQFLFHMIEVFQIVVTKFLLNFAIIGQIVKI